MPEHVALYDTTLRDGAQQEGISLSVADKLAALPILDDLGADFIEGGWPGAIPKDTVFFERARSIRMRHARLVAFGATTRPGVAAAEDRQVRALLGSGAQIITLVAKSDVRHVKRALRTSEDEGVRMVRDTVAFLSEEGIDVMVDLEHFFDGLAYDPDYGMSVMMEAALAGAVSPESSPRSGVDSVAASASAGSVGEASSPGPSAFPLRFHRRRGAREESSMTPGARASSSVFMRITTRGVRSRIRLRRSMPELVRFKEPSMVTGNGPGMRIF